MNGNCIVDGNREPSGTDMEAGIEDTEMGIGITHGNGERGTGALGTETEPSTTRRHRERER